ncbi:MAG: M48 family metallopeptidase [Bacteroidetes bacterium]|jgi:predicted Zn-dependent protease|nr:M48 family metallopeptidase [Bacteroidota bacterium]
MRGFHSYVLIILLTIGCSSVPITGRKQFVIFPESTMIGMSITNYQSFLSENPPVSANNPQARMVRDMGEKMAAAVEKYLKDNGQSNLVEGFQWEFNLVDDPTVNAWCMPGGKVVVYTGIIEVTQNDNALAVVMGHEIAHAIARHGNERMSQAAAASIGQQAVGVWMNENPTLANTMFNQAVGVGTGLSMLAFGRNQESEADQMGLIFSAMAGYDPREAPKFWERMAAASGGNQPPEFLSTHPSNERRIADLNAFMPEAMKYYRP